MSEYTPCNYCSYKRIKRRTEEEGKVLVKRVDKKHGGVNCYALLKEEVKDFEPLPEDDPHFQCWFMSLPKHCCC